MLGLATSSLTAYMFVLSVQGQDVLLRADGNDASWIDLDIPYSVRCTTLVIKSEAHSHLSATNSNAS